MRVRRGFFANCLIISVISVVFWAGMKAYGATVISIADPSDLVARPHLPLDIFEVTPTPTESPEATDQPEPDGYQLDGNDYLAVVSAEGLSLNVNGLALEKISGYSVIRFELEPLNGVDVQALYLKVMINEAGKYDLRLANFETENYRLKLKYPKGGATQEMELKPNSRILFSANFMEAILFAGEDAPTAGVHPSHYIAMQEDETTILVGAKGSLILESRPVPGSYTPLPAQPENNNPGPSNPGTNPATNPLPGGSSTDVPRIDGQLGGGGGLISCSLSHDQTPISISYLSLILGIGLLALLRGVRFSR